jgi:hypothetical protein
MSDLDSRNAGLGGQSLPPGGNVNEWQIGNSIRQFNAAQSALNSTPISMPEPFKPVPAPITPMNFVPAGPGGLRGNPILAVAGLLGLIFVAAPLYMYSVPLWIALYPAAAAVDIAVYVAVFMGLAHDHTVDGTVVGLIIAFIAAWPLTLGDQIAARNPGYVKVRHYARLPLVGIWVIYALSVHDWKLAGGRALPNQLPHLLVFSPLHIAIAAGVVIAMHFFLSKFRN